MHERNFIRLIYYISCRYRQYMIGITIAFIQINAYAFLVVALIAIERMVLIRM